jgi:hypothetical protein
MLRLKRAATLAAVLAVAACTADSKSPTAVEAPRPTISDAAHSGAVPGFYFLPPMVPAPSYSGTFDPALAPRVEICELSGTSCGTLLATFNLGTGSDDVRVDASAQSYIVNWHTANYNLDVSKFYRISVYVGSLRLGFADVDVVGTAKDLRNVDTQQYIALLDDRTLPVKFRIETGIVGQVIVSPASDSVNVGETKQFTASFLDLHGNTVSGPTPTWSSSAPAVATIDATGLATGVAQGTATITASIGYASGTATLKVIQPDTPPVARSDTFAAIGNVTIPVAAPGVLANDTDAETPSGLSVVAATVASANGGTVTLAADGSFTYLSAAGFTGTDSFSYTVTDGSLTTTGTVTINVPTRVWYVSNAGAAPGDGRDASPFATLAAAEGPSAAGETIFLLYGNGSTTGYDAGFSFKNGQSLTGQGVAANVTAAVNGGAVVLLAAGSAPTVTDAAAGATLRLAQDNTAQGLNVNSTAGAGVAGSGFGTFTAGAMNVASTGGASLDLQNGTVAATFSSLSSSASAGAGLKLSGVGGSITAPSGLVANAAGAGVDVSGGDANVAYGGSIGGSGTRAASVTGRTGGTLTLSGDITDTHGGILVQNNTGGTIAFTGASKSLSTAASNGVTLASNTGATVSFGGGGLAISTSTGTGFSATGGGSVNVTGAGNTVSSAGGVAVQVVNTDIGSSGITFRSVSANGGANGIVLSNTGSANGFQVTGSGGDCNRANTTCSGGTIAGSTGADGGTAGSGVFLSATRNVRLASMRFSGASNFAIRGSGLNGFTGTNLLVDGTFGTSTALQEGAVSFDELTGSAQITGSYLGGGVRNNLRVSNSGGSLDRLVLDGDTMGLNGSAGDDGVSLMATAGVFNVTVQNSRFLGSRSHQLDVLVRGSATGDLVESGNTLSNTHPATLSGAGGLVVQLGQAVGDNVTFSYSISGNTITGSRGAAISVSKGLGTASVGGSITSNVIGDPAVANSGSAGGSGISVTQATKGKHRVLISGNRVYQYNGAAGISVLAGGVPASADVGVTHDGSLHATVTGNTISNPGTNNPGAIIDGLRLEAGSNSGDVYTMCVNVGQGGSNNLANGGRAAEGGAPFTVIANTSGANPKFKFQGYPSLTDVGSAAEPRIESTVQAANATGGNAGYEETPNSTTTFAGNAAVGVTCDLP